MDIDDRNESIGKRIREAETEWIRYILVIGEKEVNSQNLSIRDRQTGTVKELSFGLKEKDTRHLRHPTKNDPSWLKPPQKGHFFKFMHISLQVCVGLLN